MKSAGKLSAKAASCSNGKWCWANGIAPESNHTSITSGTRRIGSPHARPVRPRRAGTGSDTSSTNGRWWSSSAVPERSASSAKEPTTCTCPRGQRHTGSGVPQ